MNTSAEFEIPYPRFTFRRKTLNLLGRAILRLLTRSKISGLKNIPVEGPVILAGNHVSTLEPLLIAVLPRRQVELLGAGDIPFEGFIDKIVAEYGFIPVNRGNLDRKAMNQALGVLKQNGVLGLFPEGGTWNPAHMKAQVGVSWLSHQAQAPIVPIGFSGFHNGFSNALKLKRPRLQMKVGKLIPALKLENDSRAIKEIYQDYADLVLDKIKVLVDPKDFLLIPDQNEYKLEAFLESDGSTLVSVALTGSDAFAQFLFSPVLLNSLANNLRQPVQTLYPEEQSRWNHQFSTAIQAVIDVLGNNPGFFTYRFGMEKGHQVEAALRGMLQLLETANASGQTVIMDASRHSWYSDGRIEEKSCQYRISPDPA